MNQGKHPKIRSFAAFVLALALCLTLAGPALAADDATASSIQLAKTEGTVSATNSAGRSVSLVKNLRLFNGYHVVTSAKSYAWLNLDSAKLLKEDASSNVEVRKSGKKLEVLVSSGNLFFNVTEPLDDDETLNIRTSTTLTGVRGTCGWVEVVDRWNTNVYILEGKVECAVTDPVSGEEELTTISAGETAAFTVKREGASATNGVKITKTSCDVEDVPGYVLVDLAQDRTLCNDIRDASGLDILGELSKGGDAAAEAQRRLEAEEAAAASRLASIAAKEQAQASKVESAPNNYVPPAVTPEPADSDFPTDLRWSGGVGWKYDEGTKTLYVKDDGKMPDYILMGHSNWKEPPWYSHRSKIEAIVIDEGLTDIGSFAFSGCTKLTSVTLPSSLVTIGGEAFNGCSSLTSITVPEGVTTINPYAFEMCRNLSSITLPTSLKSISTSVFRETSLSDVYYGGSSEQWRAVSIHKNNSKLRSATIHYAGDSAPAEPAAPVTDGDRTVLTGTVRLCTYDDLVELSGGIDPNGYPTPGTTQVIILDSPQNLTLRSGDGMGSYSSEAKCITVYSPGDISRYAGQNITFSIDPAKTYWPSGTDLPLGQPSTSDIHVLN